jgi:sialidase-1
VCRSTNDGVALRWLAELPVRPGDDLSAYHELHAAETSDGRLVLQIRNHDRQNAGETLQSESSDGRSWSEPLIISDDGSGGDLGYPSTVQLADGSLLSVWYEVLSGSPRAVLRQAHWTL